MKSREELRRAAARIAHDAFVDELGPLDMTTDPEELAVWHAMTSMRHELLARGREDGPDFQYEPEYDTMVIEGTAFDYDLFRSMGLPAFQPGACFATVRHTRGNLQLRDLRPLLEQASRLLDAADDADVNRRLMSDDEYEAARVRVLADIASVLKGGGQ